MRGARIPCDTIRMRQTFDLERKGSQDLSTTGGFLVAMRMVLSTVESGLLWGGVPCNAYGWMSSSSHGRTETRPMGYADVDFVVMSNILSLRFALLAAVALARRVHFCVENPARSAIAHQPHLRFLAAFLTCATLGPRTAQLKIGPHKSAF